MARKSHFKKSLFKKKRTKSLFKKKRTKKRRRRRKGYGGPSPTKTYKKCAKFFTKKHKLTQKKALKLCKVMFG